VSARPPAPTPPFLARRRAVRLDVRTVEAELLGNLAAGRDFLEHAPPHSTMRPPVVAVVDRGRWTIGRWCVAPPTSCLENMQDAADDSTIIHPRFARLATRQVRINRRPGLVRQPKQMRHYRASSLERLNLPAKSSTKPKQCMSSQPRVCTYKRDTVSVAPSTSALPRESGDPGFFRDGVLRLHPGQGATVRSTPVTPTTSIDG